MRRCGAGSFVKEKSSVRLDSRFHVDPSSVFKKESKSKSFNTSLDSRPLKSRSKAGESTKKLSCAKRGQYSDRTISLCVALTLPPTPPALDGEDADCEDDLVTEARSFFPTPASKRPPFKTTSLGRWLIATSRFCCGPVRSCEIVLLATSLGFSR